MRSGEVGGILPENPNGTWMGTLDAVQRYFDGWQRRDADAVLAALIPEGTYEDPTTGGPIAGEAFRATMPGSDRRNRDRGYRHQTQGAIDGEIGKLSESAAVFQPNPEARRQIESNDKAVNIS